MLGGETDDSLASDDVYTWDLRNDMVTRRNPMPRRIIDMYSVAYRDKIYGVGGVISYRKGDRPYVQTNHETLCYISNEDSWIILPQGRFYGGLSITTSILSLGEFIYSMELECTEMQRLNTNLSLDL